MSSRESGTFFPTTQTIGHLQHNLAVLIGLIVHQASTLPTECNAIPLLKGKLHCFACNIESPGADDCRFIAVLVQQGIAVIEVDEPHFIFVF